MKKWTSRCATCDHLRVSHGYSVPEWIATTCRVPGCRCDAYEATRASPDRDTVVASRGDGGGTT